MRQSWYGQQLQSETVKERDNLRRALERRDAEVLWISSRLDKTRYERDQARAAVAKVEQERDYWQETANVFQQTGLKLLDEVQRVKRWAAAWKIAAKTWYGAGATVAENIYRRQRDDARRLTRRYFRAYHRTRRALTEAEIEAADLTLQVESLTRQRDELVAELAAVGQRPVSMPRPWHGILPPSDVISTGPVVTFDPPPQYVYSNLSDGGEVVEDVRPYYGFPDGGDA